MALRGFAKFHANGIELARKQGEEYEAGTRYPTMHTDPFGEEDLQKFFADGAMLKGMQQGLKRIPGQEENAERLQKYLDTKCKNAAVRVAELGQFQGNPNFKGYRLGDCWLNNMMFRYKVQYISKSDLVTAELNFQRF